MLSLEDRMTRWEQRQEALISAIGDLTDVVTMVRDVVADIKADLEKPASSDLPDALRTMANAIDSLGDLVRRQDAVCRTVAAHVDELPVRIIRAIQTGEVA
jgi:ABC-type transporter Mla subunit MlaD